MLLEFDLNTNTVSSLRSSFFLFFFFFGDNLGQSQLIAEPELRLTVGGLKEI